MPDGTEDNGQRGGGSYWGCVSLVLFALFILFSLIAMFLPSGTSGWAGDIMAVAIIGTPVCGMTAAITGIFRDSCKRYLSVLGIVLNTLALGLYVLCYYVASHIVNHLPT